MLKHAQLIVFRRIKAKGKYGNFTELNIKHFGCHHIPSEHRGKKILATIRNPYDWYVSQYEFGWWKRRDFLKYFRGVLDFEQNYPRFPDLNFAEFVRLANEAFETHLACPPEVWRQFGWRTRAFVNFYFKNPDEGLLKMLDENYISSKAYETDLFDKLHFIHTKNLNRELYDFLLQSGYEETDIEFILTKKKVLPLGKGRSTEQKWEKYFTPELKAEIRQKERPLFEMFPEFDV